MDANLIECKRCLFNSSIAKIEIDGECEYCKLHDKLESHSDPNKLYLLINKIKRKGKNKKYDCIMGISGGLDSSTLLYLSVKKWKLRPLVIHFDNHWNTDEAKHNMDSLIKTLNVDCIFYYVNKKEYDTLNDAMLWAGVPDADIPNDIAMTKLMYETASKYNIKYILNGHDFREEGSTPSKWTYMDAKYIQDIYHKYTGDKLINYPLFTFFDQIYYGFIKGIKNVRPFHYITDRMDIEKEMQNCINFKWYGGKHCENIYTEFVGGYLLPKKFNIDKRLVYLSALIRSKRIDKTEALLMMDKKHNFDLSKLSNKKTDIKNLIKSSVQDRIVYAKYNFNRYKFLIWLLCKMKVVPYTFYKKYAK